MRYLRHASLALAICLIAAVFTFTGCGGGGGGNSEGELTLSGKYLRGGVIKAGATSAWAALGEADYLTDGTGTLKYTHSAFGPLEGLTIVYGLDVIGTLLETVSVPGAGGATSNGAITADKQVMLIIDDEEEDGLRGIEMGIHLTSQSINPGGDYIHLGYYDSVAGSNPMAIHSLATFNGDGTGTEIYENSSQSGSVNIPFTYTVGEEGRLSVQSSLPGRDGVTLQGATASDKSVIVLVDNDPAEGVVGVEVAVKKSSAMSVASLQGKYHFFILGSIRGTSADTALIDFDGAGNAVLSGFGTIQADIPATYTVADDGTFELTAKLTMETVTWKGGVRADGSMFAAADSVPGVSVGVIVGLAQWQ
jgi:hypothetical protein